MDTKKLIIQNKTEQLDRLQEFVEEAGKEWSLDPQLVLEINLVLEEYISNLVCYGYADLSEHDITIEISIDSSEVKMIITDDGNSFNIMELPATDQIEKPLEERKIGGLGVHFIKTLTDRLEYKSDGKLNRMVMVKNIPDE